MKRNLIQLSITVFAISLSGEALAQNAMVVRDSSYWWANACPVGAGVEQQLFDEGVPYDTVGAAALPGTDLNQYTMIFLADCQENATYNAWNAKLPELDAWVFGGGFLAVHATRNCSAATIQADIPGGTPSQSPTTNTNGDNLEQLHPIMAGIGAVPTGNSLAHDNYPNTGNPTDLPLIWGQNTNSAVLFERLWGNGVIIYGGLTYECYQLTCGSCGAGDAGMVLYNEVVWGSTFDLCGQTDTDGDGIFDDCDICPNDPDDDIDGDGLCADVDPCPLGDNIADTDGDTIPDGCDLCEGFDDAIDADGDTIPDQCDQCAGYDDLLDADNDSVPDDCDVCPNGPDLIDSDGDGLMDGCDNCPLASNLAQLDSDTDGVGDLCDLCPGFDDTIDADGDLVPNDCDNCIFDDNPNQDDGDLDTVGDVCDVCAGFDDLVDVDADGIVDGCDNCPAVANADQLDDDQDAVGDVCDVCAGFDDNADGDEDGVANGCDICPYDALDDSDGDGVCDTDDRCDGFDDTLNSDGDGWPDDCDNCPLADNQNQQDNDEDTFGRECDCDDREATMNDDAPEICDGLDNDCDDEIDEDPTDGATYYNDSDADGEGDASQSLQACTLPYGMVDNDRDCDDTNASVFTLATETCNEIDDNCNGEIDEGVADCETANKDDAATGCSCDSGSTAPAGLAWLIGLLAISVRRRR